MRWSLTPSLPPLLLVVVLQVDDVVELVDALLDAVHQPAEGFGKDGMLGIAGADFFLGASLPPPKGFGSVGSPTPKTARRPGPTRPARPRLREGHVLEEALGLEPRHQPVDVASYGREVALALHELEIIKIRARAPSRARPTPPRSVRASRGSTRCCSAPSGAAARTGT